MRAASLAPLALLLALLGAVATAPPQPVLLLGLVAVAAILAFGVASRALPATAHSGAAAVRARRRSLDRSPPPRQDDPDAAGHTRSRAPSEAFATV